MNQPSVFINNALLENSHVHLCIAYSCFCATKAGLNNCGRARMAYKTKNNFYLALYRKSWRIFCPERGLRKITERVVVPERQVEKPEF